MALLALIALAIGLVQWAPLHRHTARTGYLSANSWPTQGQAAYTVGGQVLASPGQRPVPIASLAKVMTACLTLRAFPLGTGDGFAITVTDADVEDTAERASRDESVVSVAAGEVLTERQALAALLLPSANNVAAMLARSVADNQAAFVIAMNHTAREFGMADTHYTDPSGFDSATVSTAADQTVLALQAMRLPTFRSLVAMPSYQLPVAGTVRNTDILLGKAGFVGIKTGSHDAAGGCFMFRVNRDDGGSPLQLTGVILGQRGDNLIEAGQYAALEFVDRVVASTR
ncbi:MAG: D-alanyl-D-alanine carboxypeptidase [Actinomycetota bacterium]|nr:D-alanyl-D-alanine carboxypeptidase [Actinomycetota bacterium]